MNEGEDRLDLIKFQNVTQKKDWFITKELSANYNINKDDGYKRYLMTTGASDKTVVLPPLADSPDRVIEYFKKDHSVGYIKLDGYGADTINGLTQIQTNGRFCGFRVKGQSSEWYAEFIENKKQYIVGNTYNAIPLTISSAGWTTHRGACRPSTTIEGIWYLEFYFSATKDAGTIVGVVFIINGITFFNGAFQAITGAMLDQGVSEINTQRCHTQSNNSNISIVGSPAFDTIWIRGNVELKNKPTWVD